ESLAKRNPTELGFAETPEEAERLWEARRSALAALSRLKPTTILEDITVPRSKIPDMVRAIERISEETGILIGTFGHAGDGNLHPTILTDERNEAEMRKAHEAAERIFKTAIELGGTLSGEHGIGLSKAPFLRLEIQEPTMSAIKALKRAFDPQGILNPGKAYSCT
ncbi:MAG TPA: glycolate oxidase subunit GlcD, partial [Armatimonadetes bacterium]|nr:glycolate oxidase subunit GlcD [Armatimonadota bacterium]